MRTGHRHPRKRPNIGPIRKRPKPQPINPGATVLNRSFVILIDLIKVLTSDNKSTTSRAFCLHARCRLGLAGSRLTVGVKGDGRKFLSKVIKPRKEGAHVRAEEGIAV
jgi:hypothetical protein